MLLDGGSFGFGGGSITFPDINLPDIRLPDIGGGGGGGGDPSSMINQIEAALQQNLAAYQQSRRTRSQALTEFDRWWNQLTTVCQSAGGAWGIGCIRDRQRGGKFDWYRAYRDPIESTAIPGVPSAPSTDIPYPYPARPPEPPSRNGVMGTAIIAVAVILVVKFIF